MILFNESQFWLTASYFWSTFDLQSYEVIVITDWEGKLQWKDVVMKDSIIVYA
jgi:hypothetical protein